MTTDELRAKFDAWARDHNLPIHRDGIVTDYAYFEIDLAWNAYQAAHASRDAEVEALRKDAERYRWLRENGDQMIGRDRGEGPEWTYWDELDQAIDAAMREGE